MYVCFVCALHSQMCAEVKVPGSVGWVGCLCLCVCVYVIKGDMLARVRDYLKLSKRCARHQWREFYAFYPRTCVDHIICTICVLDGSTSMEFIELAEEWHIYNLYCIFFLGLAFLQFGFDFAP